MSFYCRNIFNLKSFVKNTMEPAEGRFILIIRVPLWLPVLLYCPLSYHYHSADFWSSTVILRKVFSFFMNHIFYYSNDRCEMFSLRLLFFLYKCLFVGYWLILLCPVIFGTVDIETRLVDLGFYWKVMFQLQLLNSISYFIIRKERLHGTRLLSYCQDKYEVSSGRKAMILIEEYNI